MAETTQERATRHKYESDKSIKKMWIGRGITAGVVLLALIGLYSFGFNIYLLFAKPDRDGALIWGTKNGIGYSAEGGEVTGYFKLPSQMGDPVESPKFNIIAGNLIYYSPESNALCVCSGSESPKWIPLSSVITGDNVVRDIRPAGANSVVLVAYPRNFDPESLPVATAAAKYTLGAGAAAPMEVADVAYGPNGKTITRTSSGFSGVTSAPTKIVSWDYDFASGTLFACEGKSIACIGGGGRKDFGLGMLFFLRNVSAVDGELWVDAVKPFNAGHLLLAFGPDGSFKKLKVKDKLDIRPPYVKVSSDMVDILTRVSGGVQE